MEKIDKKINNLPNLFIDIKEGELGILTIIFIHSFLNGFALIFFETTASTLFLMEYSSSEIPLVYILSAVASVFFGYFFTKLESSIDVKKLLKITLFFILFSILAFFLVIKFNDNRVSYFGIMIFKDILWMFAGIEFGIITSIVFDIRQGKRLFGILVSGEIIAGIIGGLSIGVLLEYIETIDLLVISSLAMVFSFFVLIQILRKYEDSFNQVEEEELVEDNTSYKNLFKNSYYLSFFVVSALSFFVFYFIDYLFYYSVEKEFQTEKDLASFLGIFLSILNGVNLLSSLFFSGKVLKNYGIGFGLLAIPVVAVLGTSSILLSTFAVLGLTFSLIVILKILDEVLDISILTPSFKVLYQAIPNNQRTRVLTFRETVIEPIAMGLAGLSLYAISFLDGVVVVYLLILTLSAVWLYYGDLLKKGYVESLKMIINNRSSVSTELVSEYIDYDYFLEKIDSKDFPEVLYALEYLNKTEYKKFEEVLLKTLTSAESRVRLKSLEIIQERKLLSYGDYLEYFLEIEKDETVLCGAISTYSYIRGGRAINFLKPYLSHSSLLVREKTVIAFIKNCGIDGVMVAGGYIEKLFNSKEKRDIKEAFSMLNEIGSPGFFHQIEKYLSSENKKLKVLAIDSIGNLKLDAFLEELIKLLRDKNFKTRASRALKKFGFSIFSTLKDEYETSTNSSYRELLVSIIASMKNDTAEKFIVEVIKTDGVVFDVGIKELYNNNFKTKDKALVEELLDISLSHIYNYNKHKKALQDRNFENSLGIIENEIHRKIENLFYILSFLYQKNTLRKALLNFSSKMKEKKVYAIELIDSLLSSELKRKITPLLENSFLLKEEGDFNSSLQEILTKSLYPVVLIVSLVYEMAENGCVEYREEISNLVSSEDIFLEETSLWALEKLKG